jgi:hypothetical protein
MSKIYLRLFSLYLLVVVPLGHLAGSVEIWNPLIPNILLKENKIISLVDGPNVGKTKI